MINTYWYYIIGGVTAVALLWLVFEVGRLKERKTVFRNLGIDTQPRKPELKTWGAVGEAIPPFSPAASTAPAEEQVVGTSTIVEQEDSSLFMNNLEATLDSLSKRIQKLEKAKPKK